MKPLTNAERVASIPVRIRQQIRAHNKGGLSQSKLCKAYDLPYRTIRAICRADPSQVETPGPVNRVPEEMPDLWCRPDLWKRYGLSPPTTYRMV
ncbi:MAG: helix-turn-helix domain-containing protein [Geminicoccaceae bacterium]